jgi:hypothetical protein
MPFVPIFVAGIVHVLIGWIWYHPKVFGTAWMNMSGITPEMMEAGKKRMPLSILGALLSGMLIAWVMTFVGIALNEFFDWIGAIELGFWIWAGFIAPSMLGMVLWEGKSFKLYLIYVLYWLITLIAIALVLLVGIKYFSGTAMPYDPMDNTVLITE